MSHGGAVRLSCIAGAPDHEGRYVVTFPSPGDDLKVIESPSGRLWSLYSNGIQYFEDGAWVRERVEEIVNLNPPDRLIRELIPFLPHGDDNLLYLLPDRLMLYNPHTKDRVPVLAADSAGIGQFLDLAQAREGGIWITGQHGAVFLYPLNEGKANFTAEYPLLDRNLADLRHPVAGREGHLVAVACRTPGNERRLVSFEGGRWQVIEGFSGSVLRGWPDSDEGYWVLKEGFQLSRVWRGREIPQDRKGMLASEIREVAVEPDGVFWLTSSHGVIRHSPSIWRTPLAVRDIASRVHAIHEDPRGRVWFATGSTLLVYHEGEWTRHPLPEGLETQPYFTQSICSLPDGRIAVGVLPYGDYLLTLDPESGEFVRERYTGENTGAGGGRCVLGLIAPGRDGHLLVQVLDETDPEIFRIEEYDGRRFRKLVDFGGNWEFGNLRYLMFDSNGGLWVGGQVDRGGGIFDGKEFRYLEAPEDALTNGMFSICEVEPGRVWVGGRDSIWEWDGESWKVVISGMAGVRAISRGVNAIRVASGTGVHRYRNGAWVTNNTEDGLPNTAAFSILEDSRGRVWAGTIQGLALYHPEADREAPETFILQHGNPREVSPGGEARLYFSAHDHWKKTAPGRLLYSFRLDGSEWSPFRSGNSVTFENLPAGAHRFEVRAMDANLNIDPTPATFSFTVLTPWYRAGGFQLIMGIGTLLVFGLLGYALHRHLTLERLVVARTEDLRQANLKLEEKISDLKRVEESLKKEQKRLEKTLQSKNLLIDIASGLNTSGTTGEEVRNVLDLLSRRLPLDSVLLQNLDPLNDEGNWPSILLEMAEKAWKDSTRTVGTLPLSLVEAATRNRCLVVDRNSPGEPEWTEWFRERGIASACVFPVTTRGKADGLIVFGRSGPEGWKPTELELLKTASDMIVNAWLRYSNACAMLEAEKQRATALQMAERASRLASIGVMAAGITHEINQPLNDIKVTADSVLFWDKKNRGIIPDEFSQWLRSISGSVDRIDGIIRHMRSYWASPSQSEAVEFDLNESVRNALSLIGRQLANHGIRLKIIEEYSPLPVRGNRVHLEQIVLNLTVNAMHALDQKGEKNKKIEVALGLNDNHAVIEVRDNGVGLPQGVGDKLFDPFFSTRKPGEGMGLGLAIVKRFVQGFGGKVLAMRNETGGATFRVEIPVVETRENKAV